MSLPVTLAAVRCIQVRRDLEHAQTRLVEAQAALHDANAGRAFVTSADSRLPVNSAAIAAEIMRDQRRRPH